MEQSDSPPLAARFQVAGLDDTRDIYDALERRDDAWIAAAARSAASQEEFFEKLRGQVAFTVYEQAGRGPRVRVDYHCALVMVPILLSGPAVSLVGNHSVMQPVMASVRAWLTEWFQHAAEITLYSAPIGYDEICTWTPSVMREKLDQLACKREPTLALEETASFHLPEGSPTLAFLVAAVRRPCDWPQLPPENGQADAALVQRITGALEVAKTGSLAVRCVEVLCPSFASEAIASGIGRWLDQLHAEHTIRRWDPHQHSQDLVVLQLELGEDATQTSPIPLRTYQLGLDGLETVLGQVGRVASGMLATAH